MTYIATSQTLDGEIDARTQHHRERRADHGVLVEASVELVRVLGELTRRYVDEAGWLH